MALDGLFKIRVTTFRYEKRQLPPDRINFALSLILRTGTIYKVHCQITRKVYIGRTTVGVDKAMKKNKNIFDAYKRGVYKSNDTVFVVLGTGRPKRYRYPTLCF